VEPDGDLIDGSIGPGSGGLPLIHTSDHVVLLHEPAQPLRTGADAAYYQKWLVDSARL
jgi:hypothetical protein